MKRTILVQQTEREALEGMLQNAGIAYATEYGECTVTLEIVGGYAGFVSHLIFHRDSGNLKSIEAYE